MKNLPVHPPMEESTNTSNTESKFYLLNKKKTHNGNSIFQIINALLENVIYNKIMNKIIELEPIKAFVDIVQIFKRTEMSAQIFDQSSL